MGDSSEACSTSCVACQAFWSWQKMEGKNISGAISGFYVDIYHAWPPLALFSHDKYPVMRHLRGIDTESDAMSHHFNQGWAGL